MSTSVDLDSPGPADLDAIAELARTAPYAPLRYLRRFGFDVAGDVRRDEVLRGGVAADPRVVARSGRRVVGAASLLRLPDLETVFGVPCHEVSHVLTASDRSDRGELVDRMLSSLVARLGEGSGAMVMLRLEADDRDGIAAAEAAGFRHRETTLTFVNDLERTPLNAPLPAELPVRVHPLGDAHDLPPAIGEAIARARGLVTHDHYHADPRLPDDRCDELYERLLRRHVAGETADVLVAYWLGDAPASFGTWTRWRSLEPYGVRMVGSTFGFRVPGMPGGSVTGVATYSCNHPIAENRLLEWSTQADNYPMVNALAGIRSLALCRTSHVLHRWVDEV
ncbi:MAG: hypothetical protein R2698_04260 [Microthrixaceae bacterium]